MSPPTDPMPGIRRELAACAHKVADEFRCGLSASEPPTGLPVAWRGMLRSLSACCPGYTEIEYGIALNRAFTESTATRIAGGVDISTNRE